MKHLFFYVSVFLVGIIGRASAQNVAKSYIVDLQNDTIWGELKSQTKLQNYQACQFKKANEFESFSPKQIKAFGSVGKEVFESGVVADNFAELLVKGSLSLYKYQDVYYVQKVGEMMVYKLESTSTDSYAENTKVNVSSQKWRGILSLLIADVYPEANRKLANLDFREKSLTKLVVEYNQKKNTTVVLTKTEMSNHSFRFGVVAGLNYSTLKVKDAPYEYRQICENQKSYAPYVGVTLSYSTPKTSERLALNLELYYTRMKSENTVVGAQSYTEEFYNELSVDALAIPLTISYSIPVGVYTVTPEIGGEFDFQLSKKFSYTKRVVVMGDETVDEPVEPLWLKDFVAGACGGVTISRDFGKYRAGVVAKYVMYTYLNDEVDLAIVPSRLTVGVKVMF